MAVPARIESEYPLLAWAVPGCGIVVGKNQTLVSIDKNAVSQGAMASGSLNLYPVASTRMSAETISM
jgi:hypothetical protein